MVPNSKGTKGYTAQSAPPSPLPQPPTSFLGSNQCSCQFLEYPPRDELYPYKQIQPYVCYTSNPFKNKTDSMFTYLNIDDSTLGTLMFFT